MSPHRAKSNRQSGFTLIESLVAMVLLTTALVPAFILATDSVRLSVSIRNNLIAANLAQEGVEVVRAMRDASWFAGKPFATSLDICDPVAGCRVQWNTNEDAVSILPINTNPPLKLDALSGLYQYAEGTETPFHRKITISQVPGVPDERVVISEVTWTERSLTSPKSIVVESHVFDWIK